jgi:hypothetical protein
MKRLAFVLAWAALIAVPLAACNDVGDCKGQSVKPGGSCSGDQLECPYTLQNAPSPACDGTMVEGGLQTSCTCVSGTWSCPSESCDASTGGDASQGDGTTPSEAGDASFETGDASSAEASSEAAVDASGN